MKAQNYLCIIQNKNDKINYDLRYRKNGKAEIHEITKEIIL